MIIYKETKEGGTYVHAHASSHQERSHAHMHTEIENFKFCKSEDQRVALKKEKKKLKTCGDTIDNELH